MSTHLRSPHPESGIPIDNPELADRESISRRVNELGDWFHNIDLHGVATAPNHFLGDFPNVKWKHIEPAIPKDLTGATVLDIGCNGGFYSIQMKRRGAERVLGIDVDDRYLNQGRYAAKTLGLDIEFENRSVYEVDEIPGAIRFCHLHGRAVSPALSAVRAGQSREEGRREAAFPDDDARLGRSQGWEKNYHFWNKEIFEQSRVPADVLHRAQLCERSHELVDPESGGVRKAMLRSSGLEILEHPESRNMDLRATNAQRDGQFILDLELSGKL